MTESPNDKRLLNTQMELYLNRKDALFSRKSQNNQKLRYTAIPSKKSCKNKRKTTYWELSKHRVRGYHNNAGKIL